jgi:hypothetical protein
MVDIKQYFANDSVASDMLQNLKAVVQAFDSFIQSYVDRSGLDRQERKDENL